MGLTLKLAEKIENRRRSFAVVDASSITAAATAYRKAALAMDNAEFAKAEAKEELMKHLQPAREKSMRDGCADSMKVQCADGNSITVTWSDRYRALSADNVPTLRAAFGADYSRLVNDAPTVSLAKGVDLATLETAIGKTALRKLMPLLKVKHQLLPAKGAYKAAAAMYARGQVDMADDWMDVIASCAYSPSVRHK